MRLLLNSFVICFCFFSSSIYGEKIYNKYSVSVSGIKIGELIWVVEISDTNYINEVTLKSRGLLSSIYHFKGEYYSEGEVEKNVLKPIKYKHFWKTKKITKNMELLFENGTPTLLTQEPTEKEYLRVNIFDIKNYKDPLTSFLQIILGEESSMVVDGRRIYTMNAIKDDKTSNVIVNILNYSNLWADHKRTKFEKLSFEKKDGDMFPYKMNIYFDERVFKLDKN
tara:strand:+ start:3047 stop:3718 length:672 start_codon:yes stop_codon:yes gene_type:complete